MLALSGLGMIRAAAAHFSHCQWPQTPVHVPTLSRLHRKTASAAGCSKQEVGFVWQGGSNLAEGAALTQEYRAAVETGDFPIPFCPDAAYCPVTMSEHKLIYCTTLALCSQQERGTQHEAACKGRAAEDCRIESHAGG